MESTIESRPGPGRYGGPIMALGGIALLVSVFLPLDSLEVQSAPYRSMFDEIVDPQYGEIVPVVAVYIFTMIAVSVTITGFGIASIVKNTPRTNLIAGLTGGIVGCLIFGLQLLVLFSGPVSVGESIDALVLGGYLFLVSPLVIASGSIICVWRR